MRSKITLFAMGCLLYAVAGAQWLERAVVVGDTTGGLNLRGGIVVNPISGNVYIEGDPTQVFNPATAEKVRAIEASGSVVFCPPSGKGYIIGDSVVILDAVVDTALGKTALPFLPVSHAYSYTSNRLYLGSPNERDQLLVFDPNGDSVLKTIEIGYPVTALLWDSAGDRLYVGTRSHAALLLVVDCAADTIAAVVQPGLREVSELALSTVSHKLYCAGVLDTSTVEAVVVVSTDSLRPIGEVPGLMLPDAMAYSPFTDRLYCPVLAGGESLLIVDCRGDTIRGQIEAYVEALAVNTLNGNVYFGQGDSGTVAVMDTADSVVGLIRVSDAAGNTVGALTFRAERNDLYCALGYDRAYVIDASADTVARVLDYTTFTPRQMVHNPAGNKLYLFCPTQDAVVVMDSASVATKYLFGAVTNAYAVPVLNAALNRLYVADGASMRVIDCNLDLLTRTAAMPGISHPVSVMVPDINKLYVFARSGGGDYVYAYDCLRDTVVQLFHLSDAVPSAVFDPRSGRIFFACEDAPSVRVLDPVRDTVVRTFDLAGGSTKGRLAINSDLGRLYYTDQSPDSMYTIDVLSDSVVGSIPLPWDIDSLLLNRRLGKLYLCSRDVARVLVFDCGRGAIVDTITADFHLSALMNDRNDKLYLRYGAVVDCRYDSVVTQLVPGLSNPRCMAWNMVDNRVYQTYTHSLYVYRDDPTTIEETKTGQFGPMMTVLGNPARGAVRLRLQIPAGQQAELSLYDAVGRRVQSAICNLQSEMELDIRSMPAGVYFVCLEAGGSKATGKVIVQR
ncbi:MAG: T9SS type A sorting domain-containing protein [candidate division WOR-3 bacterium]|nr:T9SS type A sorting domain-containing protein [candidate division WOR-3 bacterium]